MTFSGYSFIVLAIFSIVLTQIYGLGKVDPMDDLQPEETLAVHNEIRAEVGVAPLVWDDKLAAHAQKYANVRSKDCAMQHSTDGMYGENIAAGWVQPVDTMSGPIATKFWLTEKPNYNYQTNRCSDVCGHYTQIVANQSLRLGCGTVRCHNNEYVWVVCNYAPRPMGDANTRFERERRQANIYNKSYGLPKVKPIDDVQPKKTLAVHNEIRAAVGVAPLVWNETVAAYAQKYANKQARAGICQFSDMRHSGGPYGENIAAGWVQPRDQMSGPIAAKFWSTEKPNYDHATNKCKDVCGHYTQMVANQSFSLGCGSFRCHDNELIWIVCDYYPMPVGDADTRPY